jgi:uncharacterized protein YkwD
VARLSLILGILLLVCAGAAIADDIVPISTNSGTAVMTLEEMRYLELTNKERAARGLSQLVADPVLVEAGRLHSQEMAEKSYFSHTSPTSSLKSPMDRYLAAEKRRPYWVLVGENLFYCSIVDVDRGHDAFMNSKPHRDNVLEPRYERMGVGIYVNARGEFYVTEMFLAKTDA